ncbi:protein arginine methyltransferase NDUFAF7, mitochondrial precursor [Silurus asotus]|uniref:Protein arginine methyltransferase NDUFAF7 n=1 Tax=Silurus asotus TaxID=30991 RepID=A0AAD5A2K6_SILAS|nr:protein arginine methyltransferase NDUFAF7, mitochondrial precursor [Silurus asotus]
MNLLTKEMGTIQKMINITRTSVRLFVPTINAQWTGILSRSCSSSVSEKQAPNPSMLKHLVSKITAIGPITVAEYMREVLTNPVSGYYVKNDMLGADGDFITSPEISQIFGELLGIWCVSEWMAAGKPKTFQLVELGPGRGSLTSDILRVFSQLQSTLCGALVSVHLVEVSPKLSEVQAHCLAGENTQVCVSDNECVYRTGTTHTGLPVSWYHRIEDIPRGFSIFLAHEFFDALPIHKFQRTEKGWREVMVDIDPEKPDKLRLVVFPAPTLASTTLIQADEQRQHVEVCAEGGVIVQTLASRVSEDGGAALIADYGHNGTKTDTFRGFKRHKLHDVLEAPGSADLTADVDFSYLRKMAGDAVVCFGPITQRAFLKNMGIDTRLQVLLRSCNDSSTRAQLVHGYSMLTDPDKMGHRFQFFSLLHPSRLDQKKEEELVMLKRRGKGTAPLPVAGFTELGLN